MSEAALSAFVTNLGKYNEGVLAGEWLKLPTDTETVQDLFSRIGVDGVRYEEIFITDFESAIPGLHRYFGEYESIDELNYLAALVEELDDPAKFEAALEYGEHSDSVQEIINLAQNLDCYELFPDAHYICGTSKADIARDEGVEPSVVCRSIERGLENLKKLLEKSL